MSTAEQKARDLLERMDVPDAQSYSSGDLVELANLIAEQSTPSTGRPIASILAAIIATTHQQDGRNWIAASNGSAFSKLINEARTALCNDEGLLPCPFCGSREVRRISCMPDSVWCPKCFIEQFTDRWNMRV